MNSQLPEAVAEAAQLRVQFGLSHEPIPDIISVLEQSNLAVFVEPLGRGGPWGAYLPTPQMKLVLLNGSLNLPRLRLTAAHELGHYVFKDGVRLDQQPPDTAEPASEEPPAPERVEERANAFAWNFLMPEAGVAARLGLAPTITPAPVLDVATYFHASYLQMTYRLQQLGLVTIAQRRRLAREQPALLTADYVASAPRRLPSDYVQRAFRAYVDSDVNFDRLAELLRLEGDEIEGLRDALAANELLKSDDARDAQVAHVPTREVRKAG